MYATRKPRKDVSDSGATQGAQSDRLTSARKASCAVAWQSVLSSARALRTSVTCQLVATQQLEVSRNVAGCREEDAPVRRVGTGVSDEALQRELSDLRVAVV